MMRTAYGTIPIAGGDTARPANLTRRLAVIRETIPAAGGRVLDAGCGAGEYVYALGAEGVDVRGLEYLDYKVREWEARHPGDDRVTRGDIGAMPYPDASFDLVLMNEVIEHVPDERAALGEVRRVLRPGGRVLLFAPNRRYPFETHGVDTHGGRRIAPSRTFGLPWLPVPVASRFVRPWARNYWPGELRQLVEANGFSVERQMYLWQTFENISGRQPRLVRWLAPTLRRVAAIANHIPLVRTLGVSQVVIAIRR